MNPEQWQRVREVLEAALAKSPGERARFLDQACGSNAELREEVGTFVAAGRSIRCSNVVGRVWTLMRSGTRIEHLLFERGSWANSFFLAAKLAINFPGGLLGLVAFGLFYSLCWVKVGQQYLAHFP